jgi:hypothetical protein
MSKAIKNNQQVQETFGRVSSEPQGRWRSRWGVVCVFLAALMSSFAIPAYAAQTRTITVRVEWGSPVVIAVLDEGDKVKIQSQLLTTDTTVPETIENEPLVMVTSSLRGISSAQGLSDVVLTFQIDSVGPAPTLARPTLSAFIRDFDGDEFANVTITVNPVEAVKKTAEQVRHWEELAHVFHQAGLVAAASALRCPPILICKLLEEGTEAIYEALALYYQQLASDPPDPNFMVIATPVTPSVPTLSPDPGVPGAITDAANALFDNARQSIGLLQAILVSINRASGALEAQETFWQEQQVQAAATYRLQLSDLTNKQVDLQSALRDAWAGSGFPDIVANAAQIHRVQLEVNAGGFSTNVVQLMSQLGLTADNIAYLRRVLVAQDFNEAALSGTFPANLTYQPFIDALHNAARSTAEGAGEDEGQEINPLNTFVPPILPGPGPDVQLPPLSVSE